MVQKKRLGEIALLQRGLTYSKGDEVPSSSKVVLRSNNIDLESHSLDLSELKYLREDFVIPEDRRVKKDSIFICMSKGSKQHVGKVAFIDRDMDYAFGGFMGLIVPNPSVSAKYVFYACNSSSYRAFLSQIGNGIGITNLRFSDLEKFEIPVPSIEDQKCIVDDLDLLTGIIDKKNTQLRDLDALAQSIFYECFGDPYTNDKKWQEALLESMVTDECTISYGIVQPGDGEEEGVPIVRPVDLLGTFVHDVGLKKTTKEISDSYKRTILKGNELLLCVRGTTGVVSLAADDLTGCNVSRGITPLEFNRENSRWFMFYQFKTAAVQNTISELTHGIALKGINMADVRKLKMIQPPYHIQKDFEDKVVAIDAQKERIKESIKELNSLLQSKMDGYFSN